MAIEYQLMAIKLASCHEQKKWPINSQQWPSMAINNYVMAIDGYVIPTNGLQRLLIISRSADFGKDTLIRIEITYTSAGSPGCPQAAQ